MMKPDRVLITIENGRIVDLEVDGKKGRKFQGDPGKVKQTVACLCGNYTDDPDPECPPHTAHMALRLCTCCARTDDGNVYWWVQPCPCP
jgi:hypothetical protein